MPTSNSASELTGDQIRAQRDRILGSRLFIRSKRQIDFLSYIVEAQLEGRGASLKEFSIGVDVFERDDSFNPKIDSIVRVEASRLRSKLREYYQEEGIDDPVVIEVPKGHYVPKFRHRSVDPAHYPAPDLLLHSSNLPKAVVGLTAILIVFGVAFLPGWFAEQAGDSDVSPADAQALADDVGASIAVLPFKNLSGAAEDVYFVDGVHDDVLTQLSKLSFLKKVISRTSVEQYRDTTKTIPTIGKELGVSIILEGSVQRAGDRVRVNAQLIDATTDKHIWSETYDRQLSTANIFAIQSEIADVIAKALQTSLTIADQQTFASVPTANLEAYELYHQAQLIRRTLGLGSRDQVAELLQQAVTLDPEFAFAHIALARAYIDRFFTREQNVIHRDLAQDALKKALQLRPDMPEVHVALADYYYKGYLDYDKAIEELDIAIPMSPGNSEAHAIRAFVLRRRGELDEAIPDLLRAIELDPGNFSPYYVLADTYVILGDYERSISFYDRAIELAPDNFGLKILRAYAITNVDINSSALRELIDDPAFSDGSGSLEVLYRWEISLTEGDYDLAMNVIASHQAESVVGQTAYYPVDLMRGITEFCLGEPHAAQGYFESALVTLDRQLGRTPNDVRLHSAVSLANAGLGRREAAIRAANTAIDMYPVSRDAIDGPLYVFNYAKVFALLGDNAASIGKLQELLSRPANWYATKNLILRHPIFENLRDEAEFKSLMNE